MKFKHGADEFDLEFFQDDYLSRYVHQRGGFYEADLLDYIRAMGLRGGVAVDVGANIGNHSIYFERFLATLTIAVEANPLLIPVLRRNLTVNGSGAHLIVAKGLAASPGTGFLVYPPGFKKNVGIASFVRGAGEIDSTTLDEVTLGHDVRFVKIDVEGGELEVLKGARRLLASQRPDLFIETMTPAAFDAISQYVTDFGYRPISVWCLTPTWHFAFRPSLAKRALASFLTAKARVLQRASRLGARLRARRGTTP